MKAAALITVVLLLAAAALAAAHEGSGPHVHAHAKAATKGGGTTNAGGPKCNNPSVVKCTKNPCQVTKCKRNPLYKCEVNTCGGCKTDWRLKTTGKLLVNTCPPPGRPSPSEPIVTIPDSSKGPCRRSLPQVAADCPTTFEPVCGNNDVTYNNECEALQNGTTVKYLGTCAFPTQCMIDGAVRYSPVCSDDRRTFTFTNACAANLNNVTAFYEGACNGPTCIGRDTCWRKDKGCDVPHKCKGDPTYICTGNGICDKEHILSNSTQIIIGSCQAIYTYPATRAIAAPCYE